MPPRCTEFICFADKAFYSHMTIGVASSYKTEPEEAFSTVFISICPHEAEIKW